MGTMHDCAKQHGRVPSGAVANNIDMDSNPVRAAWQTKGRKASISCSVLSERPMVWCRMWFVPLSLELMPPVICANSLFEIGAHAVSRRLERSIWGCAYADDGQVLTVGAGDGVQHAEATHCAPPPQPYVCGHLFAASNSRLSICQALDAEKGYALPQSEQRLFAGPKSV